ncbi:calcium-binding protein [Nocardioides speluncae]|uniref:calcium-binding protein n=1 Tax=Nocardioides speluncae TaxID=2670337 RepID=UPI000D69DA6F|nr:calcium-binding protein [Nocardioides speluncae]
MATHLNRAAALLPVAAMALGGLLLIPAPAQAASGVNVSNGALNVTAQAGKDNQISIQFNSAAGAFNVIDNGDTVTAGAGCTQVAANNVRCGSAGVGSVVVNAGDGDDVIDARTTVRAVVDAGTGVDQVLGSSKNDVISGGPDSDNLTGFDGGDTLNGGDGIDTMNGGNQRDTMDGGAGADTFIGGADSDVASYQSRTVRVVVDPDDTADDGQTGELDNVRSDVEEIVGGSAGDLLVGTTADNRLVGNQGEDTLLGLGGKDRLFGSEGSDTLNGGAEDDQLSGFTGTDLFSGGAGIDRVLYDAHPASVRVSLNGKPDDGLFSGLNSTEQENVPNDVEQINGSQFNDNLQGNGLANRLVGLSGDDTLIGGPNVAGQDVADVLFGDFGHDSLLGGAGDDSLSGGADNDPRVDGQLGADDMFGDGGDDVLGGCALCGNDNAPDFMMGGSGNDTVTYVDHGPVTVSLDGQANDGSTGANEGDNAFNDIENLQGSIGGGDVLIGNEVDNDIAGFGGNDILFGFDGNDDLDCGAGVNDHGLGGAGFDTAKDCETISEVP